MPKLLQINVTANWGSTGRIAEGIGECAINDGWESWIAYGRGNPLSKSHLIPIGTVFDMYLHGIQTRLLDNHGLASKFVTKSFINQVKQLKPDVIHLHNIHGYYINYELLFDFLKEWGGPVIWTLHDCWPFTGHCAHYTYSKCDFWQTHCHNCPQLGNYPASILIDRSIRNFDDKRNAFFGLKNLFLTPVSNWLEGELKKSFLKDYPTTVIHNGIDIINFRPTPVIKKEKKHILGVASVWDTRKGLNEFKILRKQLPLDYKITLIGLSPKQIHALPDGINGVERTNSISELAEWYSKATVFVNPTLEDTFPTTNLEALACGTPVITYCTGGSPEAIDNNTGIVVPYHDTYSLGNAIKYVCDEKPFNSYDCRHRAENLFDQKKAFTEYINLYHSILS